MDADLAPLIDAGLRRHPGMKRQPPLVDILHEDEAIVALNKPPGITSVPGKIERAGTYYHALKEYFEQREGEHFTPRIIHRLDKQTSGLMIIGKHTEAERQVAMQFEEHTVRKEYLVVAGGIVPDDEGEIDLPIGPSHKHGAGMEVDPVHGKEAQTAYRVLARFRGFSLLLAVPRTGRTHQIRVHLAAVGHPVAADGVYGSGEGVRLSEFKQGYRPSKRREERPLINRQALHCFRIALVSPVTNQPLTLEAPLPRDMALLLKQLDKFGR
ncbi:MAG: RluA family pseudouridine synthase [Planctomycetes bacterium]|nr:RluA family pseudouridine synthase [Planctomycetota bacterium]